MGLPVPIEQIQQSILLIRGKKVMLDADLARLYGVPTRRLNEQVKRNRDRFPEDFMFQLNAAEKTEVVAKCDHLAKLKFSPTHPYAFTEHGAIMLAAVLNTHRAIEISVFVRVFLFLDFRHGTRDSGLMGGDSIPRVGHSSADGPTRCRAKENWLPVEGEAIPISCNESKPLGFSFWTLAPRLMTRDLFLLCLLCALA